MYNLLCACSEPALLQDVYYSTPGQMGSPTHRLPGRTLSTHAELCGFIEGRSSACHAGIVSCDHRSYPYNHAAVKLTGAILPGSREIFCLCQNMVMEYWTRARAAAATGRIPIMHLDSGSQTQRPRKHAQATATESRPDCLAAGRALAFSAFLAGVCGVTENRLEVRYLSCPMTRAVWIFAPAEDIHVRHERLQGGRGLEPESGIILGRTKLNCRMGRQCRFLHWHTQRRV